MKILKLTYLTLFLDIFGEYAIGVAGQSGRIQGGNCPTMTLENGRVRIRSRGRFARFRCRRQYMLYGAKMAVCIGTKWSHQPPVCLAARCPDVDVGDSVQMTVDPKYKGALLKLSCDDGRILEGVNILYCDGTSWNADPPRCLIHHTDPKKECDFETQNLCGWTQGTDDNFDWIWHTGTTSTARTGPKTDHTLEYLNETTGHYLYIETSSPRIPGDIARIYSPMYKPIESGYCFSVWYHMLGPDIRNQVAALDIYILPEGQSVFMVEPVFHTQGNKGDKWVEARTEIGAVNSSFQVVIAATRQNSYVSDIAIDDVKISNCSEDKVETTTAPETTFKIPNTTETEITKTEVTEPMSSPTNKQTSAKILQRKNKLSVKSIDNSFNSTTLSVLLIGSSLNQKQEFSMATEPEPETTNNLADIPNLLRVKTTTQLKEATKTTLPTANTNISETLHSITEAKIVETPATEPMTSPTNQPTSNETKVWKNTTSSITTEPALTSTRLNVLSTDSSLKRDQESTIAADLDGNPNTRSKGAYITTTLQVNPNAPSAEKNKIPTSISTIQNKTISTVKNIKTTSATKLNTKSNKVPKIPLFSIMSTTIVTERHTGRTTKTTSTVNLSNDIKIYLDLLIKPVLLGVGVGMVVGLLIIAIVIIAWKKRKRRRESELLKYEMAQSEKYM